MMARLRVIEAARDSLERQYYSSRDNIIASKGGRNPTLDELDSIRYPSDSEVLALAKTYSNFIEGSSSKLKLDKKK